MTCRNHKYHLWNLLVFKISILWSLHESNHLAVTTNRLPPTSNRLDPNTNWLDQNNNENLLKFIKQFIKFSDFTKYWRRTYFLDKNIAINWIIIQSLVATLLPIGSNWLDPFWSRILQIYFYNRDDYTDSILWQQFLKLTKNTCRYI